MASGSKQETPEEFGARMLECAQGGFVAAGLSMGKDLGLFDAMKHYGRPVTVKEIADKSNMKERYIREWLGCMVTGKVIDYDVTGDLYSITADRLAALDDANYFACWLTRCLGTYPQLLKAFHKDGPKGFVPWDHVDFDTLIQRDKEEWLSDENVEALLDQVPGLRHKLESGISVCEGGCNTAPFLRFMANKYPNSRFTGFDLSEAAITAARGHAAQGNIHNVQFASHSIFSLPDGWENSYDYVLVADVLHDLPDPEQAVKCLHKIVKPGGVFSLVEYNLNSSLQSNQKVAYAKSFYAISMFYCLPVSMHFGGVGAGTLWGKENAEKALKAAGFNIEKSVVAPNSEIEIHFVCRK